MKEQFNIIADMSDIHARKHPDAFKAYFILTSFRH